MSSYTLIPFEIKGCHSKAATPSSCTSIGQLGSRKGERRKGNPVHSKSSVHGCHLWPAPVQAPWTLRQASAWLFTLCPQLQGPSNPNDKEIEPPLGPTLPDVPDNRDLRFRFWVDDAALFGRRLHCHGDLLTKSWEAVGGRRTGGPLPDGFMEQVDPQVLGYNNMGMWDLLWSSPKNCLVAGMRLQPGQVVNAVPGLIKLTVKRDLVICMKNALGPAASLITPQSFIIPEEVEEWRVAAARLQPQQASQAGASSSWWMLKQERSKGRGVRLCTFEEASTILELQSTQPQTGRRHVVVQQYITRPLLIDDRKWHIRAWVLVTSVNPLAAYLHRCGIVYFTKDPYLTLDALATSSSFLATTSSPPCHPSWEQLSSSHLTNHFQNPGAAVWSLSQLGRYLGGAVWRSMWQQMCVAAAALVASGLKHLQLQRKQVGLLAGSDFQLLGLDFLVDDSHKVWLLEANGTPALDCEHEIPEASHIMLQQKSRMLNDMCRMIALRFDHLSDGSQGRQQDMHCDAHDIVDGVSTKVVPKNRQGLSIVKDGQDGLALVRRELERCAGFEPLVKWFPWREHAACWEMCQDEGQSEEGLQVQELCNILGSHCKIPWQGSDVDLRKLCFTKAS